MTSSFPDLFSRRPWRTPGRELPCQPPTGMLGPHETLMLYDLAHEAYTGAGCIVDAGCYLGRSAVMFGTGLAANPAVADKAGRIHCFDLFTLGPHGAAMLQQRGQEARAGDSVRAVFDENTAAVADSLVVYEGDLMQTVWPPQPIEVLFVDIAKTPQLCQRVVDLFFGNLLPGKSIVIQQDYHHGLACVPIVVEFLSPYFEVIDARTDFSHTSHCIAPIPADAFRRAVRYDFSEREQLDLMQRAIDRLPDELRHYLGLAQAQLLHQLGRPDEARRAARVWQQASPPNTSPVDPSNWPRRLQQLDEALARPVDSSDSHSA